MCNMGIERLLGCNLNYCFAMQTEINTFGVLNRLSEMLAFDYFILEHFENLHHTEFSMTIN